jgi:hypothetical protein
LRAVRDGDIVARLVRGIADSVSSRSGVDLLKICRLWAWPMSLTDVVMARWMARAGERGAVDMPESTNTTVVVARCQYLVVTPANAGQLVRRFYEDAWNRWDNSQDGRLTTVSTETNVVGVLERCLGRLDSPGAVVHRRDAAVREGARELEEHRRRGQPTGALAGMCFTVKAALRTGEMPATAEACCLMINRAERRR